ncbi:helix-turn-helix domain-containing protein [Enterococcus sp. DIV1297f]|uniref:helix-turn-helix domain-containing protein n=1 Tax=Enterococcus sp. DIV1297f TaxID=2774691 RepID=UPI003D2C993D
MERSFKGIWIPKDVWLDENLSWIEKFLLVEIDSLDNEKGCWANNEYFAKFFGVSKDRISRLISSLNKKGYITVELSYKQGTKAIEKRIVRITNTYRRKQLEGIGENTNRGIGENTKDNNTSINNTFNNTNKEEVETSPVKYSAEHFTLASKLKNNLINDFPKEMKKANLEKWADVIRLMEEKDDRTIKQIEHVINWLPSSEFWFGNIRSAKKLREKFDSLKFEIKKETSNQKRMKKPFIREEPLPERFVNPEPEPEIAPERQAEINAKVQAYLNKKGGG